LPLLARMKDRVRRGFGIVGLSALVIHGCAEDDESPSGSRSAAGEAGNEQAAAGNAAGGATPHAAGGEASVGGDRSADPDVGGAGGQANTCAYPLSELCGPHPEACPMSPDDLVLDLCHVENVTRFDSSCDGVVIRRSDGVHTTILSFDAAEALTGVVVDSDVASACEDGSLSSTTIYGSICDPEGPGEDLCAGVGGVGGVGGQGG
jgi:hypothetical protein